MKLSRLSNRQLRRLLARGEVRFAFDVSDTIRTLKGLYHNLKAYEKDMTRLWSNLTYRTEINDLKDLQGTESVKRYEKLVADARKLSQDMKKLSDFANREAQKYQKQRPKF